MYEYVCGAAFLIPVQFADSVMNSTFIVTKIVQNILTSLFERLVPVFFFFVFFIIQTLFCNIMPEHLNVWLSRSSSRDVRRDWEHQEYFIENQTQLPSRAGPLWMPIVDLVYKVLFDIHIQN